MNSLSDIVDPGSEYTFCEVWSRSTLPRPRQAKVLKTCSSGFPPLALRIMGVALRLARQCQDNRLVKYWLKIVQETWICEMSPLNN